MESAFNTKHQKAQASDRKQMSLWQQHQGEATAPGEAAVPGTQSCSGLPSSRLLCGTEEPPLSTGLGLDRLSVKVPLPDPHQAGWLGLCPWTLTSEQKAAGTGCGGVIHPQEVPIPKIMAPLTPALSEDEAQQLFFPVCEPSHILPINPLSACVSQN